MSKQDLLMVSLTQFFKKKNHLQKMIKIVEGYSPISLRILDWFTTNYSKKLNISYNLIDKNNNLHKFIVYLDYKAQLKAYSKKQFDPFCRRERIIFYDIDNNEIETTVGQLNFFRWAIENNIIDYVDKNLKIIEKDMNDSIRHIYKRSNQKSPNEGRKKRHELSISATKTINKHDVRISVQFD
jgi:hypothetical protein